MLLNTSVLTETNCEIEGTAFKISVSPITFDVLSSKLYSNPILAIVRELCTNAYDSHKAAGKENTPIKINLPSYLEPNFIIRDYGIGLSKEDVMEMYITFFNSTKSDSNDFTGCFGLGSKTPFSYTSSFTVNSYWNGVKYSFIATKKNGLPHIFLIKEEPTEEENGLEISIPTDKSDGFDQRFYSELLNYIRYIPEIKIDTEKEILRKEPLIIKDNISLYSKERQTAIWEYNKRTGVCYIKQGQNTYKINELIERFFKDDDVKILLYFLNYCDIVINVPIGTLSIIPSREGFSQEEENIAKIKEQIEKINNCLKQCLAKDASSFNIIGSSLNELYNEIMTDKYFDKENPFSPKIIMGFCSTDSVCEMTKHCYFHHIDYDGLNKNGLIVQNKKCVVLLVPAGFNHAQVQKLKNTINNYEELEDKNIYIAMTYGGKLYKENILHFARNLKKTINILNSMKEYNFDIEYRTINSFYREYTKHGKPKNYNPDEKRVRYRRFVVNSPIFTKGTDSIEDLKDCCKTKYTFITFKDAKESAYLDDIDDKLTVITYFIQHVKDKKGNNFTLNYLRKFLPHLEKDTSFNVLEISKTTKKYFKEYEIINFDEIFKMIQETDWTMPVRTDSVLIKFFENFDSMFRGNFNDKAYNFIKKTKSYKKLCLLKSVAQKNVSNTNVLLPYELKNIQKYLPNVVNKQIINTITDSVLSNTLKKLFWLYNNSPSYLHTRGNYSYRQISKNDRLKVLNLLKGDI